MLKPSSRVPDDLRPNALAEARVRLGRVPFDLTISNPTLCDFSYPPDLLDGLCQPSSLVYHPDPKGPRTAREAVASTYNRRSLEVDPDRIVLTSSTSEAYGFLLRMLCDPDQTILVPSPSYPLFEQLARLEGVDLETYTLRPDDGWRLDFGALENASERVRAVVVVHPNNPTGSYVHHRDADRLTSLCSDRGWALIADEVFLPYGLEGGPGDHRTFAAVRNCLCFTLGGLSKSVGLPQLKLGWIVVNGPDDLVRGAVEALEYVADAYLPVSTPVAMALPSILARGETVRDEISERCRNNLSSLREHAQNFPWLDVLPVGGGWCVVLRIPVLDGEENLCLQLLTESGVAVYPGYFFDFPRRGYLVASLLPTRPCFREGIGRLLETIDRGLAGGASTPG